MDSVMVPSCACIDLGRPFILLLDGEVNTFGFKLLVRWSRHASLNRVPNINVLKHFLSIF